MASERSREVQRPSIRQPQHTRCPTHSETSAIVSILAYPIAAKFIEYAAQPHTIAYADNRHDVVISVS